VPRKHAAKLPRGLRLAPPTAQRALVDIGKEILEEDNAGRVRALIREHLGGYQGGLNQIAMTVVAPNRNIVAGVIGYTESGLWLFDYPHVRPVAGGVWNEWVRFDVAGGPDSFATIGFSIYDADMPIGDRLRKDSILSESELTGGHLYTFRVVPFLNLALDSIERFGVPNSAHRVPKMV
jgi:hypothetical protein